MPERCDGLWIFFDALLSARHLRQLWPLYALPCLKSCCGNSEIHRCSVRRREVKGRAYKATFSGPELHRNFLKVTDTNLLPHPPDLYTTQSRWPSIGNQRQVTGANSVKFTCATPESSVPNMRQPGNTRAPSSVTFAIFTRVKCIKIERSKKHRVKSSV